MLAEGVGRRLENFFWRIWDPRLLDNITGTSVAAIFGKISEGGYIRTTPTQSPRSSRSLGTPNEPQQPDWAYQPSQTSLTSSTSWLEGVRNDDDAGEDEETETESPPSSRKKLPPRPPPILKKSKHASPPLQDQARSSAAQPGSSLAGDPHTDETSIDKDPAPEGATQIKPLERSSKTARFKADELSSTIPSSTMKEEGDEIDEPTGAQSRGKQKPGRRKVAVVASTGSSKRRPAMRQRSSQSSSSSASIILPPQLEIDSRVGGQTREASSAATVKAPEGFGSSPVPAQRRPGSDDDGPGKYTSTEQTDYTSHAADKGRSANPEIQGGTGARRLPRHTSLTSVLKKSTAAAAASASYQATGIMDMGQGSAGGKSHGAEAEARGESNPTPLAGSSRPVPGNSSTVRALPRTKSQLTSLLQRDQKPSKDR